MIFLTILVLYFIIGILVLGRLSNTDEFFYLKTVRRFRASSNEEALYRGLLIWPVIYVEYITIKRGRDE